MTYKIDKSIPIPRQQYNAGRCSELRTTLESLEVGESMLVTDKTAKEARNPINRAAAMTKRKFTLRTVPEGVRIWRTA